MTDSITTAIRDLSVADVARRLADIRAEEQALRVLLRSLRARDRARPSPSRSERAGA